MTSLPLVFRPSRPSHGSTGGTGRTCAGTRAAARRCCSGCGAGSKTSVSCSS